MRQYGKQNLKKFFALSNLGILILLALAISALFLSNYHQATHEHYEELRQEILRSKREFIKDAVDRTIQQIEQERALCASGRYGRCGEALVKERLKQHLRAIRLKDDGYIWINAVVNYGGGDDYAYRFLHPNLPETEGMTLSTNMRDSKGNFPYRTELEGVKANGEIFFDYWFKKMNSDVVQHKLTYARLYRPYDWIIATGVYLDDVDQLVQSGMARWKTRIRQNVLFALLLTVIASLLAWFLSLLVGKRVDTLYSFFLRAEKTRKDALKQLNLELEERTTDLEQANTRLQELDRMKSMFIASMSHELRTPLNSVIGFSHILLNGWAGPLNKGQKDDVTSILRSGKHLLSLVNDVIDVSRIEANLIKAAPGKVDLHEVVSEVAKSCENAALEKGIDLQVQAMHYTLHTDRTRLLQCLLNLVSNAVKYTEKGLITISAERADNGKTLELSVSDSGIGISEEDLGKLFSPFVRLDSRLTTTVPGTGLGLYLTRKLAREVLQGDVTVASTPGVGSTFVLTVPLNR